MSTLDELYRLQRIDNHIARFRVELKKLAQETPIQVRYKKIKAELDEVEKSWRAELASQKKLQDNLEKILKRISRCDELLFSGTIAEARELTNIQKDREQNRNQQIKSEDKVLEVMQEVENLQKRKEEIEKRFRPVEAEYKKEQEEISGQKTVIESALRTCLEEREQQAAKIETEMMQIYNRLAKKGSGVAMGKINDGVCGGCFVTIPTALAAPVKKGEELIFCDRCGRLLYWEKASDSACEGEQGKATEASR